MTKKTITLEEHLKSWEFMKTENAGDQTIENYIENNRLCTCGHYSGQHEYQGAYVPDPAIIDGVVMHCAYYKTRFGRCLSPGCDCERVVLVSFEEQKKWEKEMGIK